MLKQNTQQTEDKTGVLCIYTCALNDSRLMNVVIMVSQNSAIIVLHLMVLNTVYKARNNYRQLIYWALSLVL